MIFCEAKLKEKNVIAIMRRLIIIFFIIASAVSCGKNGGSDSDNGSTSESDSGYAAEPAEPLIISSVEEIFIMNGYGGEITSCAFEISIESADDTEPVIFAKTIIGASAPSGAPEYYISGNPDAKRRLKKTPDISAKPVILRIKGILETPFIEDNSCLSIKYNNGSNLFIRLPRIISDAVLFLAYDGSVYYDSKLTDAAKTPYIQPFVYYKMRQIETYSGDVSSDSYNISISIDKNEPAKLSIVPKQQILVTSDNNILRLNFDDNKYAYIYLPAIINPETFYLAANGSVFYDKFFQEPAKQSVYPNPLKIDDFKNFIKKFEFNGSITVNDNQVPVSLLIIPDGNEVINKGSVLILNYIDFNSLNVYLPEIKSRTILYIAEDGSTYYDIKFKQPAQNRQTESIVINEVLYDVLGEDIGNEFIELYNPSNGDIDISGWRIQTAGKEFENSVIIPNGVKIRKRNYFLIAGFNVKDKNGNNPNLVINDLKLQNSGQSGDPLGRTDGVRLVTDAGKIVDALLYGQNNENDLDCEGAEDDNYAVDVYPNSSLSRRITGFDADKISDWQALSVPSPEADADLGSIIDYDADGIKDSDDPDSQSFDTDGDGLPDGWEIIYGYDPSNADSDSNGISDGEEKFVIEVDSGNIEVSNEELYSQGFNVIRQKKFAATASNSNLFSISITEEIIKNGKGGGIKGSGLITPNCSHATAINRFGAAKFFIKRSSGNGKDKFLKVVLFDKIGQFNDRPERFKTDIRDVNIKRYKILSGNKKGDTKIVILFTRIPDKGITIIVSDLGDFEKIEPPLKGADVHIAWFLYEPKLYDAEPVETEIKNGGKAVIKKKPEMPKLYAKIEKVAEYVDNDDVSDIDNEIKTKILTKLKWNLNIKYEEGNRRDNTYFPGPNENSWDIYSDDVEWDIYNEYFYHASAYSANDVYNFYGGKSNMQVKSAEPSLEYNYVLKFNIHGENPDDAAVEAEINNNAAWKSSVVPWYAIPIAKRESRDGSAIYNQFKKNPPDAGPPYKSFDNGFGIYQLTDPRPTIEQIWNWKANVAGGITKILGCIDTADNFMNSTAPHATITGYPHGQRGQAERDYYPDDPPIASHSGYYGISFGEDIGDKPMEDAIAIKMFNSANGHFCSWNLHLHIWQFNELNARGENYVENVCDEY